MGGPLAAYRRGERMIPWTAGGSSAVRQRFRLLDLDLEVFLFVLVALDLVLLHVELIE